MREQQHIEILTRATESAVKIVDRVLAELVLPEYRPFTIVVASFAEGPDNQVVIAEPPDGIDAMTLAMRLEDAAAQIRKTATN